jgi:putative two-component system response regulator
VNRILFVDDEATVLAVIQRAFKEKFKISVAHSAKEGLAIIEREPPFPVIVSDYQMPEIDGISFLATIGKVSPGSVRILLTGCAHFDISIRAINEGNIFRFLSKPCPMEVLEKALLDGLRHYQLLQTEREYYGLKRWNEGMGGLIQAFSRLIESKDPYTAGHQQRVSKLSVAIAEQLGFSTNSVEQIRMSALIHDIGKIYVPAEFLNKPGVLNASEWEIVKMHSQVGHDVLAPIAFPFPIHEIVFQHHERLDGSGYPVGIKADQIHIEAQIIAIADILEAIAHHRPYRPAKGLEEAIRELQANMGTKYNVEASKAAIALLADGKFSFD